MLLLLFERLFQSIPKSIDQHRQSGWTESSQHGCKKLGLICSCGCYLHETFRSAPLSMKWLEQGGKKDPPKTWMIHCCQAIFALGLCTYSLENFPHCSRSLVSFKMFVRNGKSVTEDGAKKKKPQQNPRLCSCNQMQPCVAVLHFCLHFMQEGCSTAFWEFWVFANAFIHDWKI